MVHKEETLEVLLGPTLIFPGGISTSPGLGLSFVFCRDKAPSDVDGLNGS